MNDLTKLAEMLRHNIQGERWFILLAAQLSEFEDDYAETFVASLSHHEQTLELISKGLVFTM